MACFSKGLGKIFIVGVLAMFITGFLCEDMVCAKGIDPANATYMGIFKHPVTLKGGKWTGKPFVAGGASRPTAGLVKGFELTGDLTGDGRPEYAVILWSNSGGSGVYYYLSVLSEKGGQAVNLATVSLGDRVQILGGKIRSRKITLKVLQHGSNDPHCCPSQKAVRTWTLRRGRLVAGKTVVKGKLSMRDLEGEEWVLTKMRYKGKLLAADPRITLIFEDGKVTGIAGCNRYSGSVKPDKKMVGFFTVKSITSTKKACKKDVMALEHCYLQALKGVTGFSFNGTRLLLSYHSGEVYDVMVFVPNRGQSD